MLNFFVFLFCAVASMTSQTNGQEENCPGYTINNNIYGPDGYTVQPNINPGGITRQGKPGKIGPRGDAGMKGDKGMKGNSGQSIDMEEFQMIRQELATLKTKLDSISPPPSCAYMNLSDADSGTYLIHPGHNTISVHCKVTKGSVQTIIKHDTMAEMNVTKCQPVKCYQRKITYNIPMSQIVALIERSAECRQYIKYRCRASVLFYDSGADHATWLSRNGVHMRYWGGATSRRNDYCACGETGTCVDATKTCNCDKNSAPETSDEGFLTDKDALPVTELQFGDTDGANEHGWHTLGPLICTGRSDQ